MIVKDESLLIKEAKARKSEKPWDINKTKYRTYLECSKEIFK